MKKGIVAICDLVLYVIVYIVLQGFCTLAFQAVFKSNQAMALVLGQASSAILTIAFFAILHWCHFGLRGFSKKPAVLLLWISAFTLCTLFPSLWLTELSNVDLPENYKELFKQIMSTPLGYLTISIIVPISEEVVFRGAILRRLLQWFVPKDDAPEVAFLNSRIRYSSIWTAISVSAFLFALFHGNLAQGFHAFILGLFLGWLFYKTKSIIPGLVFHWVNNTAAVILEKATGLDDDMKLIDYFGGNEIILYTVLILSAILLVVTFLQIKKII